MAPATRRSASGARARGAGVAWAGGGSGAGAAGAFLPYRRVNRFRACRALAAASRAERPVLALTATPPGGYGVHTGVDMVGLHGLDRRSYGLLTGGPRSVGGGENEGLSLRAV